MFITVYSFCAQPGTLARVRALYQEWQVLLGSGGSVSTELLSNTQEPAEVMLLARFPDDEAAWTAAESAGHCEWYARLVGLAEAGPMVAHYRVVEPGGVLAST